MARRDSDGAEYLVQLGSDEPPRHDDGSVVVSARLEARLTPVERAWWSGDTLRAKLAQRAFWLTGGELVDGWDSDDFASYGLEQAARYGRSDLKAVSAWVQREISRRRARKVVPITRLYDENHNLQTDPDEAGYTPIGLPDWRLAWLDEHVSKPVFFAIRLVVEQGLNYTEAATAAGITRTTLGRELDKLRGLV
jgi:hypothetical protein